MRFGRIRPAGEPLPPLRHDITLDDVLPEGYVGRFVQSGTAALALALMLAKQLSDGKRKRVLLPAYGCPDLVAAVLYVGLTPELIDTARDSPFLCHEHLAERLADDVVAVVGAHFLGFAEDIGSLRTLCEPHGVTVIEDSAQRLPGAGGRAPVADLVTMSFGRGKPAGGLGGGLLLLRAEMAEAGAEWLNGIGRAGLYPLIDVKRRLFNFSLQRIPYGLVSRLPFLRVGQTRYCPLANIRGLDPARIQLALSSWSHSYHRKSKIGWVSRWVESCDQLQALSLPVSEDQELLIATRYPALYRAPRSRDALSNHLDTVKSGITRMYGQALPDVADMGEIVADRLTRARDFAARLVTFPAHSGLNEAAIERIRLLISRMS